MCVVVPPKTFPHAFKPYYSTSEGSTVGEQETHLRPHCPAPSPSSCPGSTQAQEPCAWRPCVRIFVNRERFLLIFWWQQPDQRSCCQLEWPPWWRAPLGLCHRATHEGCSQQWTSESRDIFKRAFHGLINQCRWKGKLVSAKLKQHWQLLVSTADESFQTSNGFDQKLFIIKRVFYSKLRKIWILIKGDQSSTLASTTNDIFTQQTVLKYNCWKVWLSDLLVLASATDWPATGSQ